MTATNQAGWWLRNAHIPEAFTPSRSVNGCFDLAIVRGRVSLVVTSGTKVSRDDLANAPSVNAHGGLLLPGFVDVHTHIDKTYVVDEVGSTEGDLFAAIERMALHRDGWTEEQIAARMERALCEAYTSGTRALRTHLDWMQAEEPPALRVFEAMRRKWSSRMTLQAVSLTPLDSLAEGDTAQRIARRVRGADAVLGAFVYRNTDLPTKLATVFRAATDHGLLLDFHVDEGLDAGAKGLAEIARLTTAFGMQERVLCGHACSLSRQPRDVALRTLQACAEADIQLVSLPTTNAYLQGAWDATPMERGITLVNEARVAGVDVSFATDNVADGFYPMGGYDLIDTFDKAALLAHLRAPATWLDTISSLPARAMHLPWQGLIVNDCPADLVLFEATTLPDLLSPRGKALQARRVIRDGQFLENSNEAN